MTSGPRGSSTIEPITATAGNYLGLVPARMRAPHIMIAESIWLAPVMRRFPPWHLTSGADSRKWITAHQHRTSR